MQVSDEIATVFDVEDAVVLVDVDLEAVATVSERLLLLARVDEPARQQPRHAIWIPLVLNVALLIRVGVRCWCNVVLGPYLVDAAFLVQEYFV